MMKKLPIYIIIVTYILSCPHALQSSEIAPKPIVIEVKAKEEVKAKPKEAAAPKPKGPKDAASPLALSDCYLLALKESEFIAINTNLIKETEAHFLEALSIMLPHVSFISKDTQQETPQSSSSSSSSGLTSLKPAKSSQRNFNMTWTLFSGFKAFAAIKGSKFEREQRVKEKARAEQLLLVDVSNAFYLLLEERKDLAALYKIREALSYRIGELKERENLGRSRLSEVVNAKAQYYSVESQIEFIKSQEIIARQLLEFLVGRPVSDIADSYEVPTFIMPEDYYLEKALDRPDVEAAKYAWQLARKGIDAANSDFLPKVDLESNYYTQRTGFDEGTDWDVTLTVNVLIFDGTEVLGRSKGAELKAREKELEYLRARRSAPKDIKDAYVRFSTALTIQHALKKTYNTARLNFYLQKKDYGRNLVNNLDVLAAIQSLEDAERNYIHALYEAKRAYWQLRVATGESMMENPYDTF